MTGEGTIESVVRWRGAASVAWLAVLLAWESVSPCYAWFRSARERGWHGALNVVLAAINALIVALLFVGLWRGVATWTELRGFGLLWMVFLPEGIRILLAVLLLICGPPPGIARTTGFHSCGGFTGCTIPMPAWMSRRRTGSTSGSWCCPRCFGFR